MEEQELYKTINNYDNYEVSSFGNVRSKKSGRVLKPSVKGAYVSVGLCKNSKIFTCSVHRLVATAFLENPQNKSQVNHIDKNRSNNHITNLEWVTVVENNVHRSKGVTQTTNQNLKIWRIHLTTGEKLQLYNSIHDASLWCVNNGYSPSLHNIRSSISCSVRGVYKSSCGFSWKLDEPTNLENEIWKPVKINNVEIDNYYVSNLGRFKNSKGVIMENYKPHHSGYIYLRVNTDKHALHRLVAFTFIENLDNKPFVNHIDGNKLNNTVNNLEWVTAQENSQHNHNVGLIQCYKRKIVQYDLEMNKIKEFNSIVEAENQLGIKTIKKVLYNQQKTAGDFIWKYLD